MIHGLRKFIPDTKIDIIGVNPLWVDDLADIHQLHGINLQGMRTRKALLKSGIHAFSYFTIMFRSKHFTELVRLYKNADLVISAPGGPYIGDLYPWTEFEILFHLLLCKFARKPLMIYGPSIGPFENQQVNIIRKFVLTGITKVVTFREEISANYFKSLGIDSNVFCTADSSLQMPINPELANKIFETEQLNITDEYFGFIPLEIERFSSEKEKTSYFSFLLKLLHELYEQYHKEFVLLPQGYDKWRDWPFLNELKKASDIADKIHVFHENISSKQQQAFIGKLKGIISFRYHPTIFATRQAVPCISISYEHKTAGYMKNAGLSSYCYNLGEVTCDQITSAFEQALKKTQYTSEVRANIQRLEHLSLKNSFLAAEYLNYDHTKGKGFSEYIQNRSKTYDFEHSI